MWSGIGFKEWSDNSNKYLSTCFLFVSRPFLLGPSSHVGDAYSASGLFLTNKYMDYRGRSEINNKITELKKCAFFFYNKNN